MPVVQEMGSSVSSDPLLLCRSFHLWGYIHRHLRQAIWGYEESQSEGLNLYLFNTVWVCIITIYYSKGEFVWFTGTEQEVEVVLSLLMGRVQSYGGGGKLRNATMQPAKEHMKLE